MQRWIVESMAEISNLLIFLGAGEARTAETELRDKESHVQQLTQVNIYIYFQGFCIFPRKPCSPFPFLVAMFQYINGLNNM